MKHITIRKYASPCGGLLLGEFEGKLCLCDWATEARWKIAKKRLTDTYHLDFVESSDMLLDDAAGELDDYFKKTRQRFTIPVLLTGTDFQKHVWKTLLEIPYGTTLSYKELAQKAGVPQAVRAVANANRSNILSIFVPCHRVIGCDGTLTGYAGGLTAKRLLLELEK